VPVLLGLSIAALGLAWLSWRFVEVPFRNRARTSRRVIFGFSIVGCAAIAGFGVLGHLQRGFADRFDAPAMVEAGGFKMARINNGYCFYSVNTIRSLEIGKAGQECYLGETEAPKRRILLIGDSFAAQYEPFWDDVGRRLDISVHAVTTNWCYPSLTKNFPGPMSDRAYRQCLANRALLKRPLDNYDAVVLGGQWGNIAKNGLLPEVSELVGALTGTVKMPVLIMASPAQYVPRSVEAVVYGEGIVPKIDQPTETLSVDANRQLAKIETAAVTMLHRSLLFAGPVSEDGIPYSVDGLHIGIYGSRKAAEWFLANEGARLLEKVLDPA